MTKSMNQLINISQFGKVCSTSRRGKNLLRQILLLLLFKMKVEVAREKLLSNYEVLEHLEAIKKENNWKPSADNRKLKKSFNPDLEIITRDILSYLSKSTANSQSVESITGCMRDLNKFELEKIEKLQIINSTPYSLVNLYSIVEECDQRFNEVQCQEILDIILEHFPQPEDVEMEEE